MIRNFALALALIAAPALAHATDWDIDPAHSTASFTVKHMMVSTVRGEFGKITRHRLVVEARLLRRQGRRHRRRHHDQHARAQARRAPARSPDFFDVAKFPTLTFKSKHVEKGKEQGHLTLVGDLTIHGVTKEVAVRRRPARRPR